jgi:hypothetical protein
VLGWPQSLAPDSLNSHTRTPSFPSAALGFHLFYEGDAPHTNAAQWSVQLLAVSQTKRFLDAGLVARFWEAIDTEIDVNKRYLMPRAVAAPAE